MDSKLYLEIKKENGKSKISDLYFTVPYKIMSPFYEGEWLEVTLMSASAGLLGGDRFDGGLLFGEGVHVKYSSQSYEKIFQTTDLATDKKLRIVAEQDAQVFYMPYPVIPFAGSDYQSDTEIYFKKNTVFLYCDIFTCGRSGMGEYFAMKQYRSRTKIYLENQLIFADHTYINPDSFQYDTMGMWEGHTHNGMLYLYVGEREEDSVILAKLREMGEGEKDLKLGVTCCQKGILVRVLAMSGDAIFSFFCQIEKEIKARLSKTNEG